MLQHTELGWNGLGVEAAESENTLLAHLARLF
jgi:hypothetical protein